MTQQDTQPPAETLAIDRAEAFAKGLNTTPEEHDDIMVAVRLARTALTRRAGGDDRQWPDIGEDPMKAAPYEDRMAVSAAAIRKAYTVQQPIVPDQTALVWRWHLGALLEAEIRLRLILARDDYSGDPDGDEPASAGGDAIHTDDLAVDLFAARMKAKLAVARAKGRGGWDDPAQCSTDYLCDLLHDHVRKGDPVDVANFCMMLDHYGASTTPKPPAGGDAHEWPNPCSVIVPVCPVSKDTARILAMVADGDGSGEIGKAAVLGVDLIWGYADPTIAEQSEQIDRARANIIVAIRAAVAGISLIAGDYSHD